MKKDILRLTAFFALSLIHSFALGQGKPASEEDYYRIVTLPVPDG
jgi:hypothetical protein